MSKADTTIIQSVFTLHNRTDDTLYYPIGYYHKVENNCIYFNNTFCYSLQSNHNEFILEYDEHSSMTVKFDTVYAVLPNQHVHIFYTNFIRSSNRNKMRKKQLKIIASEKFIVNRLGLELFQMAAKKESFFWDRNNYEFIREFQTSSINLYE